MTEFVAQSTAIYEKILVYVIHIVCIEGNSSGEEERQHLGLPFYLSELFIQMIAM